MTQTRLYTKDHEWIILDGNIVTLGITLFAAEQLGDIVFVELPEVGRDFEIGEGGAVVESTKAASDVYIPVRGVVVEVNQALNDDPSLVNSDPLGKGWFAKIKLSEPIVESDFMDEKSYHDFAA